MQPLHAILNWWESLDDFTKPYIAMDVLLRLTPHTDIGDRYEMLFREFISEVIPANRHIGRVLAVRSVVDFWFIREVGRDRLSGHLEVVEGSNVALKSLSNAALGRMPRVQQDVDRAFDSWRHLRDAAISDVALESAERAAMLRRALDP